MGRELPAEGREDPRRCTATRARLWGNLQRPRQAFPSPHPAPGSPRPPTCHLGGPRDALTWPGDRRAGGPGGCGNFPPGTRSTGWLGRPSQPRLLQAGSQARTPTHTRHRRARARAHTHTHTPTPTLTHSRAATKPVCSRTVRPQRASRWLSGHWLRAQGAPSQPPPPAPGARPAPAPLPAPAAAAVWSPVPATPGLASGCAVNPRGPRPAASRARPSARP